MLMLSLLLVPGDAPGALRAGFASPAGRLLASLFFLPGPLGLGKGLVVDRDQLVIRRAFQHHGLIRFAAAGGPCFESHVGFVMDVLRESLKIGVVRFDRPADDFLGGGLGAEETGETEY